MASYDDEPTIARRTALGMLAAGASLPLLPKVADAQANDTYRTPDDRFSTVNFYQPKYSYWGQYRIAWYEIGSGSASKIVLLHGNPTWSYLYHEMVQALVNKGYKIYMVDIVGFGRSDKPLARSWYEYAKLETMMQWWFASNDIRDVNLFCQDWGGLLGLRIVANNPWRFNRVITANTALPHGQRLPDIFIGWRDQVSEDTSRAVSTNVQAGTATPLTQADLNAYDAPFGPFNGRDTKIAMRALPKLVPTSATSPAGAKNKEVYDKLRGFNKPWLCLWGQYEPYTAEWYGLFRRDMVGTRLPNILHTNTLSAAHFLQEDVGPDLVNRVDYFIKNTRVP